MRKPWLHGLQDEPAGAAREQLGAPAGVDPSTFGYPWVASLTLSLLTHSSVAD